MCEHNERNEVVYHLTGDCSHMDMVQSNVHHHSQKGIISLCKFLNKKGEGSKRWLFFIKTHQAPIQKISLQVKQNGMELSCLSVCLDDDLDQVEKKWKSYHTKWTSTQFNVSFHFRNI